jgi:glycosyltransferase involved in cell wall biosynthesis
MRNVMFISHCADLSGAPLSLVTLVNNCTTINPYVVFPNRGPVIDRFDKRVTINVVPFIPWLTPKKRLFKRVIVRCINWMAVRKMCKICKENNIELVYSNSIAIPVGMHTALKTGLPHILHIREYAGAGENALINESSGYIRKLVSLSTQRIMTNSISTDHFYSNDLLPVKRRVVYNGIDVSRQSEDVKRSLNTFLLVGFLDERKNQEEAILALSMLRDRNISAQMILAGDCAPQYMEKMRSLVEQKNLLSCVRFAGAVKDVESLYLHATCFIHCAKREPWGRVVVEAMLHRCPVIAADSDGVKEIVADTVNGFLYRSGDIEQLAELMIKVLTDSDTTGIITQTAYEWAHQQFAVSKYVQTIESEIEQVLTECYNDDN